MKVELIVGIHVATDAGRMGDIVAALERNVGNPEIDAVHVVIEDDDFKNRIGDHGRDVEERMRSNLLNPKVTVSEPGRRLFFSDHFEYANEKTSGSITVLANSDIYFDGTIGLLRKINLGRTMVCLAKYEGSPPKLWRSYDSQDAWAFIPPINVEADFEMGRPGCDNVLAHLASRAGLKLINPCLSVFAYHLDDRSRKRRRDWPVDGPYKAVLPIALEVSNK